MLGEVTVSVAVSSCLAVGVGGLGVTTCSVALLFSLQLAVIEPGMSVATREQVDRPFAAMIHSTKKIVFVAADTYAELQVPAAVVPLIGVVRGEEMRPGAVWSRHGSRNPPSR